MGSVFGGGRASLRGFRAGCFIDIASFDECCINLCLESCQVWSRVVQTFDLRPASEDGARLPFLGGAPFAMWVFRDGCDVE